MNVDKNKKNYKMDGHLSCPSRLLDVADMWTINGKR